jgi:hypothetical protein
MRSSRKKRTNQGIAHSLACGHCGVTLEHFCDTQTVTINLRAGVIVRFIDEDGRAAGSFSLPSQSERSELRREISRTPPSAQIISDSDEYEDEYLAETPTPDQCDWTPLSTRHGHACNDPSHNHGYDSDQ